MKCNQDTNINEVIVTGWIVSRVRHHPRRHLFTIQNDNGRFCVQWNNPSLSLEQGQRVMVRGELYSVLTGRRHSARVRASRVVVLPSQEVEHV